MLMIWLSYIAPSTAGLSKLLRICVSFGASDDIIFNQKKSACARRKTDVRLFVSNEYLSYRFGCIIEPTGFIMNKHT